MILVIGATGTVGPHVVRQLTATGERPRLFVRNSAKARQLLGDHVELVLGDLDRPETIEAAVDGADRVFLLTALSIQQFEQERNVIRAAQRAGVRHLVKLSVLGTDPQSPLQHARWHWQSEHLLEQSGVAFTILRMAFFMQTLVNGGMVRGGVIYSATEDGKIGMVDARDVATVAAAALTSGGHEGKTYVLTGPEALSFDEVARILSQAAGQEIRHVRVSPDSMRESIRGLGVADWYADDLAMFNRMIAAGYADVVTDDVRHVAGTEPTALARYALEFSGSLGRPMMASR